MIFVTVGTTQFNELIKAVDRMVASGQISVPVICQIGSGEYVPQHCEYFRFQPNIDDWLEKSSMVICHGGTTALSLLAMGKLFIAVANTILADDHQSIFLSQLDKTIPILWTRNIQDLPELVQRAATFKIQTMSIERLADDLRNYLE